jgi:endonuclease VIII
MPEGDTVHLAARRLEEALGRRTLTRTDFRVPHLATTDLSGRRVAGVIARGKHLLVRIDGGVSLHTHFKMEGAWHVMRSGQRYRAPGHHVRVVLETSDLVAVGIRLATVELIRTQLEHTVVGHLGPDPLGPDWDPEEALRRIASSPNRPLEDALVDQTVMAGPGNVYKCEACFLSGLDPRIAVGDVPDLAGVIDLMRRLMQANRATGSQVTTGDTRRGRQRWVYGRGGKPCRRCGTPIARRQPASGRDRVTYWCPHCQPTLT